jgi:hypothetical protein
MTLHEHTGQTQTDPHVTNPANPARPSVSLTSTSPDSLRTVIPHARQRFIFVTRRRPDLASYLA